jgi:hypothetical protein
MERIRTRPCHPTASGSRTRCASPTTKRTAGELISVSPYEWAVAAPRRLTCTRLEEWAQFAVDGKSLYFLSTPRRLCAGVAPDFAGGEPEQVTKLPVVGSFITSTTAARGVSRGLPGCRHVARGDCERQGARRCQEAAQAYDQLLFRSGSVGGRQTLSPVRVGGGR